MEALATSLNRSTSEPDGGNSLLAVWKRELYYFLDESKVKTLQMWIYLYTSMKKTWLNIGPFILLGGSRVCLFSSVNLSMLVKTAGVGEGFATH